MGTGVCVENWNFKKDGKHTVYVEKEFATKAEADMYAAKWANELGVDKVYTIEAKDE